MFAQVVRGAAFSRAQGARGSGTPANLATLSLIACGDLNLSNGEDEATDQKVLPPAYRE